MKTFSFVIIWILLSGVHAFHFYSEPGMRTCFYKDLTKDSLLVGRYQLEIQDPYTKIYHTPRDKVNTGVLIELEETYHRSRSVVHQQGSSAGQFTFSALDSGEHRICFTPKSFFTKTKWFGKEDEETQKSTLRDSQFKRSRIMLDFLIGDSSTLDKLQHKPEHVKLVQHIMRLVDRLTDIRREQQFIREKESQFRDQSERTCDRVLRYLIFQSVVICGIYLYQVIKWRTLGAEKRKKD